MNDEDRCKIVQLLSFAGVRHCNVGQVINAVSTTPAGPS